MFPAVVFVLLPKGRAYFRLRRAGLRETPATGPVVHLLSAAIRIKKTVFIEKYIIGGFELI